MSGRDGRAAPAGFVVEHAEIETDCIFLDVPFFAAAAFLQSGLAPICNSRG
ncbi:hypothetical protein [Mesorhizobium sp.]|uniref:hypothetical protein n=1 Tax=Mesorhizobium sp. TaxID=1871066 RepID=UPI0025F8C8CE|nr:hypothetical protein [Mesorhizobium sp.]